MSDPSALVFGRDEDRRRFLGLVAEVQAVGDMEYAAAAQGVRRFWKQGGRGRDDEAIREGAVEKGVRKSIVNV